MLGTWHNPEDNKHYLDVSITVPDREKPLALGAQHNQKAIFDLQKFETIPVSSNAAPSLPKSDIPLEHRSNVPGLQEIDPAFWRSGQAGAERERAGTSGFLPRSYWTRQGGAVEPTGSIA